MSVKHLDTNVEEGKIESENSNKTTIAILDYPEQTVEEEHKVNLDDNTIISDNVKADEIEQDINNENLDSVKTDESEEVKTEEIKNEEIKKAETQIIAAPSKEISPSNQEIKNKEPKSVLKIIGIIFLILFIVLAIAFSVYTISNANSDKITYGVSIKGIDISGLTKNEAKELLEKYISSKLPENIQLKHLDYETSISLSSLEASFDIDSAINKANSIGKAGNLLENEFNIVKTFFSKEDIEPDLKINDKQLVASLNDISGKLPDTVIESSYYIEGNNLIITKGKEGNVVNTNQMATYIKNGITNLTLKNRILDISTKTKQPNTIDIEKIYEQVHKPAVNASYTQNPFTVYPSENGLDFDISLDDAKALIENEEKDEYTIPLKVLYPSITTNMIGTEAFPDLLSSFSTNYSASAVGRTTNLRLAASKINGTVVMPGEVFSYNKVVGARTIAAGYKEAPIYVQGKVVDGLGGGICQITSTLYNAVVYANLEVVERTNHQFVPSYVTASRDATVVYGSLDFKFKNNRNYPIKILCSVSGGVANFQIFGLRTNNDYDVEISSYVTGRTGSAIYSEAYKILKQNGQVVDRQLLSRDTYKAH